MEKHIKEVLYYLIEENTDFSIACEIEQITFKPELPSNIKQSFKETVLFVLSGYTLETAHIKEGYFIFEAGFGGDNFGSVLNVPLLAIKQALVDENPIILNLVDYKALNEVKSTPKKASNMNSMEALLKNPKNKKLLKRSLKPKS
jgi:hypothetical protein